MHRTFSNYVGHFESFQAALKERLWHFSLEQASHFTRFIPGKTALLLSFTCEPQDKIAADGIQIIFQSLMNIGNKGILWMSSENTASISSIFTH